MITEKKIVDIVKKSYLEILEKDISNNLNMPFTGYDSTIESIEIVQIIATIEELLNKEGCKNYDLLERVFDFEALNFEDLIKLLVDDLIKIK